jgi:hypothetical protein
MEWYEIALIIVILWAVVHTYVDMQVKKKVDEMVEEFKAHKH